MLRRIAMPVPFAMRTVNAYLEPASATLVDCGVRTRAAWDALVGGLASAGMAPKDVRRVVLTHAHVDHFGNLARLQEANPDLEALVHPADRRWIEDYDGGRADRFEAYRTALLRCGLDPAERARLDEGYRLLGRMAEGARVTGSLRDGDALALGASSFEVLHVPGHSPGCVAFLDRANGLLLSGDVLLEKVTTNAVNLARDERAALAGHRASLARLAATGADHVLPGHREPFRDARAVAGEHLENIAARTERVLDLLGPDPITVRDLVRRLFLEADVDLFLACSELLGHLSELGRGGRAVEEDDGRWRRS